MLDAQFGESVVGSRTFATVRELLSYNCTLVCGSSAQRLTGANGSLLQKNLCHMPRLPGLLQPEPPSPWRVTAGSCLRRGHSNTERQVWLSLLWRSLLHSLGPGVSTVLSVPSNSLFPQSREVLQLNPPGLQSQIPWVFSVPLLDLQVEKSALGLRTFATVRELLCYNCSPVCGSSAQWLYRWANGSLLQEALGHMLCLPGLLQPEPLSPQQATVDPCLRRRHSNTQRQAWLSLLWGLWVLMYTRFCLSPPRVSGGYGD